MLGLCLVAVFALSAMAAVPALAKKGGYTVNTWTQYKYCPYTNTEVAYCVHAETSGGPDGGFFTIGNVKVPLSKPVVLQGGFIECEAVGRRPDTCPEGHEEGGLLVVAAVNGGETLESPELPVIHGLNLITKQDEKEAGWPQALIESFKEAKANKETGLNVKIELAGGSLFENWNGLNVEHIINQHGAAFELPLKTRLISSWLEKLGGGPCTIGNNEHPIMQYLTSEAPGSVGVFDPNEAFTNIELKGNSLVDLNWPVEAASGATGCGGAYESYVDAAINDTLGLQYRELGTTVLTGNVFSGDREAVQEEAEAGNV
jgi:hypothetical protein